MWGISIHADFRPMGISFHTVVVFGLGKNLLFKSALEHCGMAEKSVGRGCGCFFGRIEESIICFRDLLIFRGLTKS